VAGQTAKPALGTDGTRVPLLRPGFRPSGPYQVSFVYLHAGTPFGKKGELDMALPKMDIPVGLVSWEVFVPERYKTSVAGGNAIDRAALNRHMAQALREEYEAAASSSRVSEVAGGALSRARILSNAALASGAASELRGVARDTSGAVLPGVTVDASSPSLPDKVRSGVTDAQGQFRIAGLPPGLYRVEFNLRGFSDAILEGVVLAAAYATIVEGEMRVGLLEETVTVTGASPVQDVRRIAIPEPTVFPPSGNVVSLQRRTAGVLPIRVDVPKAGTSLQFVKPLVVDQEVVVKLRYKLR
jgi:hypothetical protein